MDHHALIQFVKQHEPLEVKWDAGGDSTGCFFPDRKEPGEHEAFLDELRDLVIQTLQLPNTGDRYDKGSGVLHLFDHTAIALTYSSCKTENKEEEESTVTSRLVEDPLNLRALLHRAEITITGYTTHFDDETLSIRNPPAANSYTSINVIHGEAITFPPKSLERYHGIASALAHELSTLPYATKGDRPEIEIILEGTQVYGKLTRENTVDFSYFRTFKIIENIKNRTELLLCL